MISSDLVRSVAFSIPAFTALVCLSLMVIELCRTPTDQPVRNRILRRTIVTHCMVFLLWTGMILYDVYPKAFVDGVLLFVPLLMSCYILIYRWIFTITYRGDGRPFSLWHYSGPVVMLLFMIVAFTVIGPDRITHIVYDRHVDPYMKFFVVATMLIYSVIYPIMGVVDILRFRRNMAVGPTNPTYGKSYYWILGMILLEILVLPISVCGIFLGWRGFADLGFAWIPIVMPTVAIYILTCHNLLSDNYMAIEHDAQKYVEPDPEEATRLSCERIERYMEAKKPYLNPEYRIIDMAGDLFTNRAYISNFINSEYGMNFSRFLNGYRLREVARLRREAEQRKQRISSLQLILNAGFNSYRSYLRAKDNDEDKFAKATTGTNTAPR